MLTTKRLAGANTFGVIRTLACAQPEPYPLGGYDIPTACQSDREHARFSGPAHTGPGETR